MRLRYWAKIIRMKEDRIVKIIYRTSRDRLEKEEAQKVKDSSVQITDTWCVYTRNLMHKLNLTEEWRTEAIPTEEKWNQLIRERIHEREQIKWAERTPSSRNNSFPNHSSQSTIEAVSQNWSRSEEGQTGSELSKEGSGRN